MPKIQYQGKDFSASSRKVIDQANAIIEGYQAQGFKLTLRQLYYQFVSKAFIPNTIQSYKRLGSIINDARLAGEIDWLAIEDRTRETNIPVAWATPGSIIESAAASFRLDKWQDQPWRVEVWIEKEALAGVFEPVCTELNIPFLCCRGYTSQSEMWQSAMRMMRHGQKQKLLVLHFGDHDPSGIDMSRDIEDRLRLFGADVEFRRLALMMAQVEEYAPPPNPAKVTDSRFEKYQQEFGGESWELDALEPAVLADLVRVAVKGVRDEKKWIAMQDREDTHRDLIGKCADRWRDVVEFLKD